MSEYPAFLNFTVKSPWIGRFRYFTKDGIHYREPLDEQSKLIADDTIKEVPFALYRAAYRTACLQADDKP